MDFYIDSALYIVSTPIGNLADMTFRAITVLKSVQVIAAEDTRHSQILLSHYHIHTPCISLHEYNEATRLEKIISRLRDKKSIALISDAGTPLISDPGFKLVRAVREANFPVIPIPGACASIAALVASGLPTDRFIFEGFLPVKSTALEKRLSTFKTETRTMIFYESAHRIVDTLQSMKKIFGADRVAVIAKELTKSFETIEQNCLATLCEWITADPYRQKGEFVILLQGSTLDRDHSDHIKQTLTILLRELPLKQAVSLTCRLTHANKKMVYTMALSIHNQLAS